MLYSYSCPCKEAGVSPFVSLSTKITREIPAGCLRSTDDLVDSLGAAYDALQWNKFEREAAAGDQ